MLKVDELERAQRVGDEMLTAEFLATEGLLEWLGGMVEDGRELSVIGVRQLRYLLEDGFSSVEAVIQARSLEDVASVPEQHVRRRLEHLGEGLGATGSLVRRSTLRAVEPLRNVWLPFLEMVRRDVSES